MEGILLNIATRLLDPSLLRQARSLLRIGKFESFGY